LSVVLKYCHSHCFGNHHAITPAFCSVCTPPPAPHVKPRPPERRWTLHRWRGRGFLGAIAPRNPHWRDRRGVRRLCRRRLRGGHGRRSQRRWRSQNPSPISRRMWRFLEAADSGRRGLKRKSGEGPQHPIARKARTRDSSDSEESKDYPHLWPDFDWERPVSFVPSTKLICPLCNFRT
jgi:hypothetical protein